MDHDALSQADVLTAIAECQKLGKDEFYRIHGKISPTTQVLICESQHYDASSIASAAHKNATGNTPSPNLIPSLVSIMTSKLDQLEIATATYGTTKKNTSPQDRIFGEVPDIKPGHEFTDRDDARLLRVHRANQAGIVGNAAEGAESIVSSDGYEDDLDLGNRILYTGHGGQKDGKQVSDQTFKSSGNAALLKSELLKQPVRVVRRIRKGDAKDAANRYRYDGLFMVTGSRRTPGRSGLMVCRFTLEQIDADYTTNSTSEEEPLPDTPPRGNENPKWSKQETNRPNRSKSTSEHVKNKYENECQICHKTLMIQEMPHSEGAHIRPLGFPDYGPDQHDNILCLCPNCHYQFDNGAVLIDDNFHITVNGTPAGELTVNPNCRPSRTHLAHHRSIHQ